jgi:hypothetical protein
VNATKVASACVVTGNVIRGSASGYPPVATGVRCEDGSCARITGNVITGRGGGDSYGIWLGATGTLVDRNAVGGGCAAAHATGIHTENAFARIQNNNVVGFTAGDCGLLVTPPSTLQESYGMHVLLSAGRNELDVHSNTIDATGRAIACSSYAVALDLLGAAPSGGLGIFRNNIMRAGICTNARVGFAERAVSVDPRVFQNNDIDPTGAPTALYLDEGTTPVTTAAGIDLLGDMVKGGTISADPLFKAYPTDLRLSPGSPCADMGTATGAPALDFDGAIRDSKPDIGADEL